MQTITSTQTTAATTRSTYRRLLPSAYWALAGILMGLVAMTHEDWAGTAAVVLFCAVPLAVRCGHEMLAARTDGVQDAQAR